MLEATSDGWGVVGLALEALVPSVQRCALDPSIYPGAAEKGHKMMEAQKADERPNITLEKTNIYFLLQYNHIMSVSMC